jgi:hypothetical protein
MSIVGADCANQVSGSICNHIRDRPEYEYAHYEPPIFWLFDSAQILPLEAKIDQKGTDPCHYEVTDVSNNRLWNIFKAHHWSEFSICTNGQSRPLQQTDIDGFVS